MKFFIKVCVVFNTRCKDVTKIMLSDFLDAISTATEYLGENDELRVFPHCMPTNFWGGYVYPHEGFVQHFRKRCACVSGEKLTQHRLWKRFIRHFGDKFGDDVEVGCFVDKLCSELGIA